MTSEPLSASTAVLLLADHQTGVLDYVVKAPRARRGQRPRAHPRRHSARHPDDIRHQRGSQNGTLLPALAQAAPEAYAARIERHDIIDALADPAVAEAMSATGRRQLVTAGIGTDVCGVAPALHARRDGYQVTFAADAAGSLTEFAHDISLRRTEHDGITVTTTATVIAELASDYPTYAKIMRG
jgi:nicotinamidase-related amidase